MTSRRYMAAGVAGLLSLVAARGCGPGGGTSTTTTAPATTSTSTVSTTTTVAPTPTTGAPTTVAPTTTVPPVAGQIVERFDGALTGWTFARRAYENPTAPTSDARSTATVVNGQLRLEVFDQNYGSATMRAPQQYDLSKGPLTVTVDDDLHQLDAGWAFVLLSADPQDGANAPRLGETGPGPYASLTNAVAVQLGDSCRVPWGPPFVDVYRGAQAPVERQINCPSSDTSPKRLQVTQGAVSVQLQTGGEWREIIRYVDVAVPTVGWVHLGGRNHSTEKFSGRPSMVATFDDLSYSTPGGAPSPTTTSAPATSVPASTTSAPTTSTSSTVTASSTTAPATTAAPTTTAPPAGVQFFEDFTTDTRARFDWRLQVAESPNNGTNGTFLGEHNMACESPATYRTIVTPLIASWTLNQDITNSPMVWWCAPGGDVAKGHMMTALDTHSVATLSFSPKQVFSNVQRVCWDQNMNNLGEGKWINMFVVPASDVARHGGAISYAAATGEEGAGVEAVPQKLPAGAFDFSWIRGSMMAYHHGQPRSFDQWQSNSRGIADDPAPRFTICIDDAANTVSIERPGGGTDTYRYDPQFPQGQVRVIFQDASYNPTKHNGSDQHLTWHWDNIEVA